MNSEQKLYRFSPVQTEEGLRAAIIYVMDQSEDLLKEFVSGVEPITSLTIFSHYPDEYEYLNRLVEMWGVGQRDGYIELKKPFVHASRTISKLRVRKPDPYRSQVGCADFSMQSVELANLIKKYPHQVRLIERPGIQLVEFHHPDYDVLAYVPKYLNEQTKISDLPKEIKLFGDGGSRGNPGPSASGFVIMDMNNHILYEAGVYLGITTNNQAEYQALKFGLEQAKKMGAREVHAHMDSLLVINQMKGIFKVKNRDLWPIYEAIKALVKDFEKVNFTHVPRELNKLADAEVNKCLDAQR